MLPIFQVGRLVQINIVTYWELSGGGFSPWLLTAPDGSVLLAVKDSGGLYRLQP